MTKEDQERINRFVELAKNHLYKVKNPELKHLAISFYKEALEINPNDELVTLELANAWDALGNRKQALSLCDKVLNHNPASLLAAFQKCFFQLSIIDQSEVTFDEQLVFYEEELKSLFKKVKTSNVEILKEAELITSRYYPTRLHYGNRNILKLQQTWGKLVQHIYENTYKNNFQNPPLLDGEKIKIGFVSGNFNMHPDYVMLLRGWLSHLDKNIFEIYGYYISDKEDVATEEIKEHCHKFVLGKKSIIEWRNIIASDKPHALIYSEVGFHKFTNPLAGVRLAPVQCTTWGNPLTTGLKTMDYFLSNELAESDLADEHYSEKLVRLPFLSCHFKPKEREPHSLKREDLGCKENDVIFMCAQPFKKYQTNMDEVFAKIAASVQNSKFIFFKANYPKSVFNQFEERLEMAFSKLEISFDEKVIFLPWMPTSRYLAVAKLSDVFLDSFGFSGGTSTLQGAVSNGLPVVTLPGDYLRGRQSLGILKGIGITETIANDFEDYVNIAVKLATDSFWRKSLSKKINEKKHLVFEDQRCIRGLEQFLSFAVDRASKNLPPVTWPTQ